VLHEAESRLGVTIDPDDIIVEVVPNTQIIQIKVQDKYADHAVAIANTLVQILIEQNETLQAGRYTVYEKSLNSQIAEVQGQIQALQGQIAQIDQTNVEEQLALVDQQITNLQAEVSNLERDISNFPIYTTASERARLADKQSQLGQLRAQLSIYQQIQTNLTFIGKPLQNTGRDDPRITGLQTTLSLYQQLYLNLLNNLETVKLAHAQSTPTVTPIEEAIRPEKPIRPIPWLYITISGFVGLLIAAGVILLLDSFDDTLRSAPKVQEILGIPVVGEIMKVKRRSRNGVGHYLIDQTSPSLLNAFGFLRINVSRLIAHRSRRTILITSPALGEGKTTIAANLAAAFVQSGRRVVLLDADLYHPAVHALLGVDNQKGLTDILAEDLDWQDVAQDVGGMTVITGGTQFSTSVKLLESEKLLQLLGKLQKRADVIIVDGPPLFVMDAQILASIVGGVLLIVRQGDTITAVARAMLDQLKLMEANVLGVVLNCARGVNAHDLDGYYRNTNAKKPKGNVEKTEAIQS
jgi:capsular exopolysaccharide synthesis family protein